MVEPLEPLAQSVLNAIGRSDAPEGSTCLEAYALSTAISLKRIADALQAIEAKLPGDVGLGEML